MMLFSMPSKESIENGNQGFDFDFDDSDEQIIEEQALDLSSEMRKRFSKLQQRS